MSSLLRIGSFPLGLLVIATVSGTWYNLVSGHVPDPYLDEVFHVPQSQRYCKNDFTWDPKITTPPGLQVPSRQLLKKSKDLIRTDRYILSWVINLVLGDCSTSFLRALNAGAICVVFLLAYDTLRVLNRRPSRRPFLNDVHSALNISLFPPLFFFSSLYYTDVISTLVVLLTYNIFLKIGVKGAQSLWGGLLLVPSGILALCFRQTNIFWVAVFPGGLALVKALKAAQKSYEDELNNFVTKESEERWRCSVSECHKLFSGYQFWRKHVEKHTELTKWLKSDNAGSIMRKSWNGGYVYDCPIQHASLEDYILFTVSIALVAICKPFQVARAAAPYVVLLGLFAGFVILNGGVVLGDKSNHVATIHIPQMLYIWPYIIFFSLPITVVSILRPIVRLFPNSAFKAFLKDNFIGSSKTPTPGYVLCSIFTTLGLFAVHYNTIVHPFTLADNRHYVFYVFRILRWDTRIKYLAVPLYYICAWMTFQTLAPLSETEGENQQNHKETLPMEIGADRQPCQISFVLVWLVTTALSVITAPLVEPRYFIIPFIIWRLHVPNIGASLSSKRADARPSYDVRLVLETIWLLAVNAAIGYNFLYHGFSWPNEPGKVQRFLW